MPGILRRDFLLGTAAAGFAGLSLWNPGRAEDQANGDEVTVAVSGSIFRDVSGALAAALMHSIRILMEGQTGYRGNFVAVQGYEQIAQQLADGKCQLAVMQGFELAWAREKHSELKPLVIAINRTRQPRALLVVRQDGPIQNWADLKGTSVAIPKRAREFCHLYLERRCLGLGEPSSKFFKQVVRTPAVEETLDYVFTGRLQAAILDVTGVDWYRDRKPARHAQLRVLQESEVFPPAAFVCHPRQAPAAMQTRICEGMTRANDSPRGRDLMTLCQITSLDPVPPDYERLLGDIAKAYPTVAPAAPPAMAEMPAAPPTN